MGQELHVVAGKGPVGSTTAALLAAEGHRVRVLSRSGAPGRSTAGIEHVAVDLSDAGAVRTAAAGAAVVYNCANPTYHRWATDWPPMAAALLDAASAHGSVLVTMSNLYGYGPVDGPLTEDLPLAATGTKGRVRVAMWEEALARHRAGDVRATEARASDFYGPGVTDGGLLGERLVPRLLAGRPVQVPCSPDQPHSWTYVPDVAAALVVLGRSPVAWGRAWHVPSGEPRTVRQMVGALAGAAGVEVPPIREIPWWVLRAAGVAVPFLRELRETRYQFDRPFVIDGGAASRELGLRSTPVADGCGATVAWWRERTGDRGTTGAVAAC